MASPMLLTPSSTPIIGIPIAWLLGKMMNGIFYLLNAIHLPYVGLAIILFTVVIYMCLMPLTVKQQKFSKMSQLMQPEMTRIQEKYKGRRDNDSMAKMQDEMNAVYKKYGVSPSGSCIQLLIQMPILFALYQVIYKIPAYVTIVKDTFTPVVNSLMTNVSAASEYLQTFDAAQAFTKEFTSDNFINNVGSTVSNTFIDVLNRFSTSDWTTLASSGKFENIADAVTQTTSVLTKYNFFLGLDVANSPWYTIRHAGSLAAVVGLPAAVIVILAILVPVLAAGTQWLNILITPQASKSGNEQQDQMTQSMKMMNIMMPLMSAYFCLTLPSGMGLYWIFGALIRTGQMIFINKKIDKMDIDKMLKENEAKYEEKRQKKNEKEKAGESSSRSNVMEFSKLNTKGLHERATIARDPEAEVRLNQAEAYYANGNFRKGSLAEKANMVSVFNNSGARKKPVSDQKSDTKKTDTKQQDQAASDQKADKEKTSKEK